VTGKVTTDKPDDGNVPAGDPCSDDSFAGGPGAETPGSTPELLDLRRNLHSLTIAMREVLEVRPLDQLSEGEISPDQLRVLRLVSFNQGSRVGQVAEGLGIKPSSASLILDRLETRGYIERYSDADDRRITRLRPTEKGERVFEEAEGRIGRRLQVALKSFDAEKIAGFNTLLGEFIRGMMEGEKIFASLCFHCGIQATGTCVLDQKYENCPYLHRISADRQ